MPPQRIVEVLEGEHKIKFIFEEYGEVEKIEEIGNEETKRIHCDIGDHPQLFSKKCTYELVVYPKASIKIDGKSLGEVPPIKHRKVSVGKHKLSFVLRDNSQEYVDIEVNDSIEIRRDKKIHLVADVLDFEKQENSYLATEDLLKSDKDWIVIKSNHEIQVEINGIVKGEVSLLKDLKLQEIQKSKHRIKLILQRSNEDYRVEINIFKIVKMKHQKVKIAIEML